MFAHSTLKKEHGLLALVKNKSKEKYFHSNFKLDVFLPTRRAVLNLNFKACYVPECEIFS